MCSMELVGYINEKFWISINNLVCILFVSSRFPQHTHVHAHARMQTHTHILLTFLNNVKCILVRDLKISKSDISGFHGTNLSFRDFTVPELTRDNKTWTVLCKKISKFHSFSCVSFMTMSAAQTIQEWMEGWLMNWKECARKPRV